MKVLESLKGLFFSGIDESSGHRLRISDGDTLTARYQDNTLPESYTSTDKLDVIDTATIHGVNSVINDEVENRITLDKKDYSWKRCTLQLLHQSITLMII